MSRPAELPPDIRAGFDEILRTTESLIDATREWDPAAIRDALDRRGEAIERLEPCVLRFRDAIGSADTELLARESAALEVRADEARRQLGEIQDRIRDAAGKLSRNGVAIRAYATEALRGGVLNRPR